MTVLSLAQTAFVQADAAWQRIDFISDVHLEATQTATLEAWVHYMGQTPADALFVLGDLFEVWVGDDNPDPFVQHCMAVLKQTAKRLPVYFLCGNRDFLIGPDFFQRTGVTALQDPSVLDTGTGRFLLTHGDALCLEDQDYLTFRSQVRTPSWQAAFLAKPLSERLTIARQIRQQSEARKQSHHHYADVDHRAAQTWLEKNHANVMIHGHTHRPSVHALSAHQKRWVLSDWHAESTPVRLEVLQWRRSEANASDSGLCRVPLATA